MRSLVIAALLCVSQAFIPLQVTKKYFVLRAAPDEVASLKSGSSAMTVAPQFEDYSKEELAAKLLAYQQFMAKYIVKSQEDKMRAIKVAEEAIARKYEEKMAFLLAGAPSAASPSAASPILQAAKETKLYMDRNARISEAAKAGKSRWGDMETQRAAEQVAGVSVGGAPVVGAAVATAVNDMIVNGVPPEVEEADHGLRADGGVGGPSLAERVAMGAAVVSATASHATPVLSSNQALYQKRNARISEAAKVGKSRWGDMETQRAKEQVAGASVGDASVAGAAVATAINGLVVNGVPPEVEEADHGLRADGGVGGPSLAERVAMGAAVVPAAPALHVIPVLSSNEALYQKRNAMVSAAGKAGKSRWGDMEVQKAAQLASLQPAHVAVSPQVADADHGLRADGGVGGPFLADRVNLGAQLLNKN